MDGFHPALQKWFRGRFNAPTRPQAEAWPAIRQGHPVLIAAPTGSGKTLAAFLSALDDLFRQGARGELPETTQILYISPLKALSTDIAKNLEEPLQELTQAFEEYGTPVPPVRVAVRTGDTVAKERRAAIRRPPHIQVTTPESLFILLTSESGQKLLSTVRFVIIDEIHALFKDKRGAHLALSLERLDALVHKESGHFVQRVGLSATQKPIEEVARFLVGQKPHLPCVIVDSGHQRTLELSLVIPPSPLEALLSAEDWQEIYDQLTELILAHRTTLIFANTRRLTERVALHLSERIGSEWIQSHHGSMSHERRREAEEKLKSGQLRALVATASLELGIDIGDVDLVCQLGSPRSIATFLQRVGRSGHSIHGTPRGKLFPLSRDDLVECCALLDSTSRGELDALSLRENALDILAQQIVASVAASEWGEEELFECLRSAYPYRNLQKESYEQVLQMLADGFNTSRGRRGAYIHWDRIGRRLTARRGARLVALTSGGAIPDTFDYDVVLEPSHLRVGSLHEDFALESQIGDIFQLGNTSYRILRVEAGQILVADASGLPPSIPFWIAEAPPRTDELSFAVSRLREWVSENKDHPSARTAIQERLHLPEGAVDQLFDYLLTTEQALGVMPTQKTFVVERFFDETESMHVVLHAPWGSRFTRAFGLALRKRFCRSFNVELQAAAGEDALVLSLGPMHSFPLESLFEFLHSNTARDVLIQALLDSPFFQTRWRWNASRALAIPRFRGGKKVPPRFQRMQADDLLALCFPDQVACLENIVGDRQIPSHPLVEQTIEDSLHEAMDVERLLEVLRKIEQGEIQLVARDLKEPSPLAHEILTSKPYTFLDDAPLEERRTQAVRLRRFLTPEQAQELGRLDPAAIQQVCEDAWPDPRHPDELHDTLSVYGFLTDAEGRALEAQAAQPLFAPLQKAGRATRFFIPQEGSPPHVLWLCVERAAEIRWVHPKAEEETALAPLPFTQTAFSDRESALRELVRSRLELVGPITAAELGHSLGLPESEVLLPLQELELEGFLFRGSYRPSVKEEFCERRLLARIHRTTLHRLRREIEPLSAALFIEFLAQWQGVLPEHKREGREGTWGVLEQLAGFPLPASSWEAHVLPNRVRNYAPEHLDELCLSGRLCWRAVSRASAGPLKNSPLQFFPRGQEDLWTRSVPPLSPEGADAERLYELLQEQGALFFAELLQKTGLLPSQAEAALRELIVRGLVTTDSFVGLRTLLTPADKRGDVRARYRGGRRARAGTPLIGMEAAGRISLTSSELNPEPSETGFPSWEDPRLTELVWALLQRWGVLFRKLLEREGPLPPWRDLLRVLHRLEAQGKVRAGRFVHGFSGEQFALPEVVDELRQLRRRGPSSIVYRISAADPLNLAGILTPGERIPTIKNTQILWYQGEVQAVLEASQIKILRQPPGWSAVRLHSALRLPFTTGTAEAKPAPLAQAASA